MQKNDLYELLKRHIDGSITSQQNILLEELINKTDSKVLENTIFQILKDTDSKIEAIDVSFNKTKFEYIFNRIESQQQQQQVHSIERSSSTIYKYLRYISSIAAVLIAGIFVLQYFNKVDKVEHVINIVDIDPAQSIAKISIGNGDTLTIDSTTTGLVYNEKGIRVYRSAEGVLEYKIDNLERSSTENITITTPKGGYAKLTLSDGTIVSLNSASTIMYPVVFDEKGREISAEGEIFFDIAKDKTKPFRVFSAKQTIEVLGTTFNLSSSHNEAKTTLIEGSVKILVNNMSYILKPGQQSIVTNSVEIKNTNVEDELAWTNDQFLFDNGSFFDILKEIENWYDIKFVFERDDIQNMNLSGSLSRKVKLSELLKVLSINTGYNYEIQERRVLVK